MAKSEGLSQRAYGRWLGYFFISLALAYAFAVLVLFLSDPYGRSGIRTSATVPNLAERYWMVTRAMDQQFNSAIVGNSTSIPMQPEILDRLTGARFASLSIAGSGAPVALKMARFFLSRHANAKILIVALDDSWCRSATGMAEGRPFPFWLYDSDPAYIFGLFANASFGSLREGLLLDARNSHRIDGYHPYDEAFFGHGYDNIEAVIKRLSVVKRPVQPQVPFPYAFEPPRLLEDLVAEIPQSVTFVLFWTPRYVNLIPISGSPAETADKACKEQTASIARKHRNVRVVDWSGAREENLDPSNFFEANHYRDTLALKIQQDIAAALKN